MAKKPVVGSVPETKKPVVRYSAGKIEWVFSFKYFRQIKYFGFSRADSTWFSSLFSRLSDLSKLELDRINKDPVLRAELRYHPIDWQAQGIPVGRAHLDWLDKDILENEEEFVFYQVHVSKALGRIVGFWYENIFYVVLLDQMHNMQPSIYNNYTVRQNTPVETDISALLNEIDNIKGLRCEDPNCTVKHALQQIPRRHKGSNAVILFLDDDFLGRLNEVSQTRPLSEIVEQWLMDN